MWYPGRIVSVQNGSYRVRWHEPEDGLQFVEVNADNLRCALIPLEKLPGLKI